MCKIITHHAPGRFIPGLYDCFNIQKSINVISYINRLKNKSHEAWPGVSVGASPWCDRILRHTEESTNECKDRWKNNKSMFLSPSLPLSLSPSLLSLSPFSKINKLKFFNHMMISIDALEVFNKRQHPVR